MYNKVNYDEGTCSMVHYNESSLYPRFVMPREFQRSLLGRIQGTEQLVRHARRLVLSGVHYIGIPLYPQVFSFGDEREE